MTDILFGDLRDTENICAIFSVKESKQLIRRFVVEPLSFYAVNVRENEIQILLGKGIERSSFRANISEKSMIFHINRVCPSMAHSMRSGSIPMNFYAVAAELRSALIQSVTSLCMW